TENGEPAGLEAVLTYATDLFDPATAEAVARRWTALLDAALADPAARVGDLDLLLPEERHLVPARGPRSRETVTLPELLATTAAAHPDRPAVVADGHTLTYRELDRRAARLAARLAGAGAGRETVVALGLARGADLLIALWAVARTGAAFLPVDPKYPAERVEHMLTDSGATLGLTLAAHAETLPGAARWIVLDEATGDSAADGPAAPGDRPADGTAPRPDLPAWMIYTSGSTGTPKGVTVTHRGLADLVAAQRETLRLDEHARVLQVASPSFDASVFEALMAFGAGGAGVVAPPDVYGGAPLAELIAEQGVTHMVITPSALATLDPEAVPSVR